MSHVTHINESRHTYPWVPSDISLGVMRVRVADASSCGWCRSCYLFLYTGLFCIQKRLFCGIASSCGSGGAARATCVRVYVGLFCIYVGLFCICIGLFCIYVGLFCICIGLFCGDASSRSDGGRCCLQHCPPVRRACLRMFRALVYIYIGALLYIYARSFVCVCGLSFIHIGAFLYMYRALLYIYTGSFVCTFGLFCIYIRGLLYIYTGSFVYIYGLFCVYLGALLYTHRSSFVYI